MTSDRSWPFHLFRVHDLSLSLTLQHRVSGLRVAKNLSHLLAQAHVQDQAGVIATHEAFGALQDGIGGPRVLELVVADKGLCSRRHGRCVSLKHALDTIQGAAVLIRGLAHGGGDHEHGGEAKTEKAHVFGGVIRRLCCLFLSV